MSKLLVLKGLPASGKSTYAKELVAKAGNYGRVNRDDLRAMIFNSKWSRSREKIIIDVEKAIAKVLLDSGHHVIVDDTNFRNPWVGSMPELPGTLYEELSFGTPIDECIRRDKLRESPVGGNVIRKMAARNGLIEWPDKPIVLVDIDGTLASSTGREKYLESTPKDWDSYFRALGTDVPVTEVFRKVKQLSDSGHTIVIVSGRGAEWEEDTIAWFEKIWQPNPLFPEMEVPHFPVFQWFFRDKGDRRDDTIVKAEVLKLLPRKPVLVLDDRPKVCRMWEANDLKVEWVRGRDLEDF